MLVYSAADFEDILEPRPDTDPGIELQPMAVALLACDRQDSWRTRAVPGKQPLRAHGGVASLHRREQLVFFGARQEGFDCARTTCRSQRALGGLFRCS